LGWEYGVAGEAFEGFLVLEHPRSGTAIAYCQHGFGPAAPWGLISTRHGSPPSMGMSDGWCPRFLDAFFESKAPTDLDIWRVKERKPGQDPTYLISASDHHLTRPGSAAAACSADPLLPSPGAAVRPRPRLLQRLVRRCYSSGIESRPLCFP